MIPEVSQGIRSTGGSHLKLFCFPNAGASALAYREWYSHLSDVAEVVPAELPGRGRRITEAPFADLPTCVQATAKQLMPALQRGPFALFGHSMGALIAFELERLIERELRTSAVLLCVAGSRAPHLVGEGRPVIWNLPKLELIETLRSMNGTPAEILDEPDSIDFLLPLIRTDIRMVDTYRFTAGPPLACPLLAMGGLADRETTAAHIRAWNLHTAGAFSHSMFEGDHFFVRSSRNSVLASLSRRLLNLASQ